MKKKLIAAAMMCSAATAATASASTILYEPFDYSATPTGTSLNTLSPASVSPNAWTKGGTTNDPTLASTNLSYAGLPASAGTSATIAGVGISGNTSLDRIQFSSTALASASASVAYYSMLIQVPSTVTNFGGNTVGGSFFAGLNTNPDVSALNNSGAGAAAALCVRQDPSGGGFNLGIVYRDTGARVFDSTKFLAGQTIFAVVKYDSGTTTGTDAMDDVASLYLNPSSLGGADPGSPNDTSANFAGNTIHDYYYSTAGVLQGAGVKSIELRNNTLEPSSINVDEIRVGTSWADVTSDVPAPEPASLGLLGIAGCGALARRRRQA